MRRHTPRLSVLMRPAAYRSLTRCAPRSRFSMQARSDHTPVVLGIETSCDDTAIAVVNGKRQILYEAAKHWREYKGVHPALALREHENALPLLLSEWQKKHPNFEPSRDLSAVAVTSGPGLALALNVGVRIAREFAKQHSLPLLSINHLAAHNLVARLKEPTLEFPFLSLLISGGHSQLLVCEGVNKFQLLGGTHDDSVGEAFDKSARLLNLDASAMPAGEALERAAATASYRLTFTVPLRGVKDCNFSFSGLKAQVAREIRKSNLTDPVTVAAIAAGFQDAAVAHLEKRTERALMWCKERGTNVKALAVVGGVARNNAIRTKLGALCAAEGISLVIPQIDLCSDNGVMVAWTGVEQLLAGVAQPTYDVQVQPRWQLDTTFNPRKFVKEKKERKEQTEEKVV